MSKLRIASYNCRSFSTLKHEFIRKLLSSNDILLLQEHWLSDGQLPLLGNIDNNFAYTGVSGFGNREILTGRPYGGCAILWRSSLNFSVEFMSVNSNRVSAIKLSSDLFKLLLINVYMPCEDHDCNVNEFSDVLFNVECLLVNNIDCHYAIGGDFNVDLSRNSVHTALLRSFSDTHNLLYASESSHATIDFTYNFNMSRFSLIDNFILSSFLFHSMLMHVNVLHDVSNLSDHEPLFIELQLPVTHAASQQCLKPEFQKVSWTKASDSHITNYRHALVDRLKSIIIPFDALTCSNRSCNIDTHRSNIVKYASDIADACVKAGLHTIPRMRPGSRVTPGFSEHVKPYREKSMFWHKLWMDCGRPRTGHVADCMRRTRAAYHYAMRRVKRDADEITRDRFAAALLQNNSRDFWTEVKKIRASKLTCNGIVDGHSDASEIARIFGDKYRDLYTSVSFNKCDMHEISDFLDSNIIADNNIDFVITPLDVSTAVSHIKHSKNDVDNMLTSDHFIYAPQDLNIHISMLFSTMLMHGSVPDLFLNSSIRPIPKGHNLSTGDSSNYRGIAIGSIFCKIFDNIILCKYHHLLLTSDLQFGFKKGHCTQMCTMVLKETVSYYLANRSNVFCTFLDATKAFDRLNYCKLFRLMIGRSLPYCIIRILLNLYINNFVFVSWYGSNSPTFLASNGVKQGGVLSPVLFCVYMDGLLNNLSRAGIGCYMSENYVGALAYADDIVLLAPTPNAMKRMLAICDGFAVEHDVMFNASKSKCIYFHPKCRSSLLLHKYDISKLNFVINGYNIEFVDTYKHLGHVISSAQNDDDDINEKRSVFIGQANNVLCYFAKLSANVKFRLFSSYCTSFFGSELWRMDNVRIGDICTAWRKAIRRIWTLPYNAHSRFLPLLCNCLPVNDQFCERFLNFVKRCISDHSSPLVRTIASHGLFSRSQSPLGYNFMYCMRRYHFNVIDFLSCSSSRVIKHCANLADPDDLLTVSFLRELIYLRDRILVFSEEMFLNYNDISSIIECVASS